jgi:ABC-type Fe3+ transport system substrate-binding protein
VSDLAELQNRLGRSFRDEALLRLALTHPSVAHDANAPLPHNQRLEFLGDAVLGLILSRALYDKFPDADEGALTKSRAKLVNTGALAAQMLSDKEVQLAVLWNTRAQAAAGAGAPVGVNWAQNQILAQAYGISKGTAKMKEGVQFIDYSLSPEVQARWLAAYNAIPVNKKAYPSTAKSLLDPATNTPWTVSQGFRNDIEWWAQNRAKVSALWNKWVLQ